MEKRSTSPDAENLLISQAIEGDKRSMGVLYDRYLNLVYNYVYYRIGTSYDTELVTEKIFLKVFQKLYLYPKEGKGKHFLAWVFKLASQELDVYLTKHPKINNKVSEDFLDEKQEEVVRALRLLDDQDYQFIVSRFFNGLNDHDLANIIGVRTEKINDVQLKALQALEKRIKKDGQDG
jgi:RNA polymerase sigma factor (sigma-70 family)